MSIISLSGKKTILLLISSLLLSTLLTVSATDSSNTHYLKADVTNKLESDASCPGWVDSVKWEIAFGVDCGSASSFTSVGCLNDQKTKIDKGGTVRAECQLNDLPAGDLNTYCLR